MNRRTKIQVKGSPVNPLVSLTLAVLLLAPLAAPSAGETNRVVIDPKQTGAEISPLLFGHNLEITRRGVWRGLSAEMIANRKFAAAENGQPKRWTVLGAGGRVEIDASQGYAGKQSARVEVRDGGKEGGIAQVLEGAAFQKDAKYALRVCLKSDTARTVKARLVDAAGEPVFFEREWPVESGTWQLFKGEFVAPPTGGSSRLEISSQGGGVFWLGAVSLQPATAFHGMRRDVVELLKRIRPGCLRYPGGCYAEFYNWQHGLLPVDQRPPIYQTGLDFLLPASDDTDTLEIGIDEFIALCREIGCQPAITVRLSENTPDDAAAWVEYCNGDADTRWGRIRAGRGQAEPYRVQWWFVGNEIWSFGRGAARGAAGCAAQSRLFTAAMKHADPTIRLVPCTQFIEDTVPDWNAPLLESVGPLVNACSVHKYILDQLPLKTLADYAAVIKAPTQKALPVLQRVRRFIDQKQPADRKLGITYDEWNTLWGRPGSVPMGLYAAGMLNMLCREAEPLGLEMACYFMPINEGAIAVAPSSAQLDTAGYVFELYQVHQGNRLLKTPAMSPDADLDLCASATPDSSQIFVTVVNRNLADERMLELELPNWAGPVEAEATLLVPPSLDVNAREFGKVIQRPTIIIGQALTVTLPPGAIACVRWGKPRQGN